ncbi:DUF4230 domain-containing protein, partial [Fulvivirga sp. RKSG066]|uniref:DUF4230 domain-containing protein n=1 Tax=Fulvivirga aurantia TaxID=2529383 RepID=UPI0012BC6813|nr:DUF4230 domain-containing protein [Fulvivirga aurantia]
MRTIRFILLILPWLLLVGYLVKENLDSAETTVEIETTAILQEVEALGKLELVKYNFKEITELKEISKKYLQIFQLGPDSKIALISSGEAVGCIDMTQLKLDDIRKEKD